MLLFQRRWPRCATTLSIWTAMISGVSAQQLSDLPPQDVVIPLILSRPEVTAATAAAQADRALAQHLQLGPHEYALRLSTQQRRSNDALPGGGTSTQRYIETQLGVERTWRRPAKAQADAQVADATVAAAQIRRADAIHETSRRLLRTWYDWQRDRTLLALSLQQTQAQQELVRIARQRVKAGDAALTESMAQEAALAQLQAEGESAQAQLAVSKARLLAYGTTLPDLDPPLATPGPQDLPQQPEAEVLDQLQSRSHEAMLAHRLAELARTQARRSEAERQGDPTVGVYAGSERGGAERLLGVSLSTPWGGAARQASAQRGWALAQQADEEARLVDIQVAAAAKAAWVEARSAQDVWRHQDEARQRQESLLKKVVQGWQMGEFGTTDVLMARRQFLDAAKAEVVARTEARHAAVRLWLDLHAIWECDDETE